MEWSSTYTICIPLYASVYPLYTSVYGDLFLCQCHCAHDSDEVRSLLYFTQNTLSPEKTTVTVSFTRTA